MKQAIQKKPQRKPTNVRKREIIEAAISILAQGGPRAFTAKNIADAVGITSGTIFRHFVSMEAIVADAIALIEKQLEEDFPVGIDNPLKRLKVFFVNRTNTILSHPDISYLLLSDQIEQLGGSVDAKRLTKIKARSRKFVYDAILDGEQTGATAKGVNADVATIIVIGAILSMSHASTQIVDDVKSRHLVANVWIAIEQMLKAGHPLPYESGSKACLDDFSP